jgi:hypothetical protein
MRPIVTLVAAALVAVLAGYAFLGVARLETSLADAGERLSTLQYEMAADSLAQAEQYAGRARWVPWLGSDARNEIAAREAALQYWRRDYGAVLPEGTEPVAEVDEANVELQLVVANAGYRVGQTRYENRESTVRALEEAAAGYLTVLKSPTWHPDAAFNYEYLIRMRDRAAGGQAPPPPPQENEEESDLGEAGAPTPATAEQGFEIYVPLEEGERNPSGGEAGQAAPRERQG